MFGVLSLETNTYTYVGNTDHCRNQEYQIEILIITFWCKRWRVLFSSVWRQASVICEPVAVRIYPMKLRNRIVSRSFHPIKASTWWWKGLSAASSSLRSLWSDGEMIYHPSSIAKDDRCSKAFASVFVRIDHKLKHRIIRHLQKSFDNASHT